MAHSILIKNAQIVNKGKVVTAAGRLLTITRFRQASKQLGLMVNKFLIPRARKNTEIYREHTRFIAKMQITKQ